MIYEHEDCGKYQDCPYRSDVGWCPLTCLQYRHKDEVRVVRCKDCRFWHVDTVSCDFVTSDTNWYAEDYCSYGERKDNERV